MVIIMDKRPSTLSDFFLVKKHAKHESREVSLVTAAYFEYHALKAIASWLDHIIVATTGP